MLIKFAVGAVCCLVFFCLIGGIGYCLERKSWNGGVCAKHGSPWKSFDCDSQGGRGYKCTHSEETCGTWISYPLDAPNPRRATWNLVGIAAVMSVGISAWAMAFASSLQR